ncbi:hypothetical protein L915_12260, partial [Phytophthora nicotianae]
MCILLGYSYDTKGIKLLSLQDGGVRTSRLENVFCHEKFAAGREYVMRLLTRAVFETDGAATIPIVEIKAAIETYSEGDEVARQVVAGVQLEGQVDDLADISLQI